MKTCTGCEAEIAAEAETCPHCGAEMAAEAKDRPYPGFWFVFVGAVVASLLVVVGLLLGLVLLFSPPASSDGDAAWIVALAGALALLLMLAARAGVTRLFIQVLRSEWKTYALSLAVIAILVIVALRFFQPSISNTLNYYEPAL